MTSRNTNSTKVRILHLVNIDIGVLIHLRNQLLYLQSEGFEVAAACSPGNQIPADTVTDEGIPVKTIRMTRQITPFKDLLAIFELYRFFRSEKPDIVHTHSAKPGLLGRVAAFLAQVPIRIHTIHGLRIHNKMSAMEKRFNILMERVGSWFGHVSLSQGQFDIEIAVREKISKPDQILYLGNGVDVRQFTNDMDLAAVQAKKQALGIPPTDKVVGFVGRQTKIKGCLELIKAAQIVVAQLPKTKFIIIGPPEEGSPNALDIQGLLQQYHLYSVVLPLGFRQDMRELYGIMDVITLPSWIEGVPRVLIEASICGKPIVATDIPGNREIVQHELNGLLVPVGDAQALAGAILDLLTDEAKAFKMGQRGKQRSLELFDEQACFERLKQTYEDILRAKLPSKYAAYQANHGAMRESRVGRGA